MINLVRPNIMHASGYVPGEQPTEAATIKLNTNENPYAPSPRSLEAISTITAEQLRRYPNPMRLHFAKQLLKSMACLLIGL